MGRVDPWVGSGWVEVFQFFGRLCWVGSTKEEVLKIWKDYVNAFKARLDNIWLHHAVKLLVILAWVGLGPNFPTCSELDWVGSVSWWVGLDGSHKMDPWTTLVQLSLCDVNEDLLICVTLTATSWFADSQLFLRCSLLSAQGRQVCRVLLHKHKSIVVGSVQQLLVWSVCRQQLVTKVRLRSKIILSNQLKACMCRPVGRKWNGGVVKSGPFPTKLNETESNFAL